MRSSTLTSSASAAQRVHSSNESLHWASGAKRPVSILRSKCPTETKVAVGQVGPPFAARLCKCGSLPFSFEFRVRICVLNRKCGFPLGLSAKPRTKRVITLKRHPWELLPQSSPGPVAEIVPGAGQGSGLADLGVSAWPSLTSMR